MNFPIYIDSTAPKLDQNGAAIMCSVNVVVVDGRLERRLVVHPDRFCRVVEMLTGEYGLAP